MERLIREWGVAETEERWHAILVCRAPEVLVVPQIVKCLSR